MPKSILFDKEQVMQQVTELFWEKGYNGTSMQDLVEATGLNRSSIYNTFGDKFQLFQAALEHYRNTQNNILADLRKQEKSPMEVIKLLFDGVWSEMTNGQIRGCFLSNCASEMANSDATIKTFLVNNQKKVVSTFQTLIEQAQQIGEINPDKNPEVLAQYLFSSLQGLRITAIIDSDKAHIKAITDHIFDSL